MLIFVLHPDGDIVILGSALYGVTLVLLLMLLCSVSFLASIILLCRCRAAFAIYHAMKK